MKSRDRKFIGLEMQFLQPECLRAEFDCAMNALVMHDHASTDALLPPNRALKNKKVVDDFFYFLAPAARK